MKYKVQFMRYFEEFDCCDYDIKEFNNLKEANDFLILLVMMIKSYL